MPYSQDISACLADRIGRGGLPTAEFERMLARLAPSLDRLRRDRDSGALPHLTVPARRDDLGPVAEAAGRLRGTVHDVLVLGTGGSSLGGAALVALATDRAAPRLHFLDNVDPAGIDDILARVDLAHAGMLIISKSGTTAETLSQALMLLPVLRDAAGEAALPARVTVISDPLPAEKPETPLRRLAGRLGLPVLDHEAGIGGRFAALTNVGLLPAAIAGLDPAEVREGAAEALAMTLGAGVPSDAPAAIGAALAVGLLETCGVTQTVLCPYLDRLAPLALWYRQLWAESLGKDGHGTNPVAARGTVDQHSQLQLWRAGPADKMYTFVFGRPEGTGARLDAALAGAAGLEYLHGRTMGDLLAAEQEGTAETLIDAGRPTRILRIARPDARACGALMMHFMLETILAADLIGVAPFDQPAVEDGKRRARERLAAMGGEAAT